MKEAGNSNFPNSTFLPMPLCCKNMATSWLADVLANPFVARLSFYPTVLWGVALELLGLRPRYNRIDGTVLLGGLPFSSTAKKLVEEEGIKGVVILNEEYETHYLSLSEKDWKDLGVEAIRIATTDFDNAPSLDQLASGVLFIQSFRDRDESVYVHCKAGRGRSALMALCYVMQVYHKSPEKALTYLQEKRPHVLLGRRQWIAAKDYFGFIQNR